MGRRRPREDQTAVAGKANVLFLFVDLSACWCSNRILSSPVLSYLLQFYYQGSDAIIFVVDSIDAKRFELAKEELSRLLAHDELRGIPVLVYANKQVHITQHGTTLRLFVHSFVLVLLHVCRTWPTRSPRPSP